MKLGPYSNIALTRRSFIGSLASSALLVDEVKAQPPEWNAVPADATVQIEWELPRRYAAGVASQLGVPRSQIRPSPHSDASRGGGVLVIIVATVLAIALARTIVSIYRDLRYGGLIIQDTPRGLYVRHDRRLPGNIVIIRDRNGTTVRVLRDSEVNLRDLAPIIASYRRGGAR